MGAEAVLGAGVVEGAEGPGELGRDVGIPGATAARLLNVLRLGAVVRLLAFKPEKKQHNIYCICMAFYQRALLSTFGTFGKEGHNCFLSMPARISFYHVITVSLNTYT